jgi:hypothetical protein
MSTNLTRHLSGAMGALVLALAGGTTSGATTTMPAGVQTITVARTNWTPRYITNLIEVNAPQNVFVDQYRTNWIARTVTNIVEVTLTNWTTRSLTNVTTVMLSRTNFVERFATNWTTVAMTNWNTLTLTNWETVIVTKTNWVRQPMVNVVEVNVPAPTPETPPTAPVATVAAVAVTTVPTEVAPSVPPVAPAGDALVVDVERLNSTAADNRRELKFSVRLVADSGTPLLVEQWRVERDDAAVLFFAQTQEFKRALPPGRYKIEVRARRDAAGPLLTLRRTLEVTGDSVVQR